MVANLPLLPRSAYLLFRRCRIAALRRNLNTTSWAKQYFATISSTFPALAAVADAWIFQPCVGSSAPSGARLIHSSFAVVRQVGGTVMPPEKSAVASSPASGRSKWTCPGGQNTKRARLSISSSFGRRNTLVGNRPAAPDSAQHRGQVLVR